MIPGLNVLGLGGNRLRATIPTEIFSLSSLTSLSLSTYFGFCVPLGMVLGGIILSNCLFFSILFVSFMQAKMILQEDYPRVFKP